MRERNAFCLTASEQAYQIAGGHAELMVAYAEGTMLIPDGLSYEQAAPDFSVPDTLFIPG